jgi:hypothetical protein
MPGASYSGLRKRLISIGYPTIQSSDLREPSAGQVRGRSRYVLERSMEQDAWRIFFSAAVYAAEAAGFYGPSASSPHSQVLLFIANAS